MSIPFSPPPFSSPTSVGGNFSQFAPLFFLIPLFFEKVFFPLLFPPPSHFFRIEPRSRTSWFTRGGGLSLTFVSPFLHFVIFFRLCCVLCSFISFRYVEQFPPVNLLVLLPLITLLSSPERRESFFFFLVRRFFLVPTQAGWVCPTKYLITLISLHNLFPPLFLLFAFRGYALKHLTEIVFSFRCGFLLLIGRGCWSGAK